jgi:hypothetical protein
VTKPLNAAQAEQWIRDIRNNVSKFRRKKKITEETSLEFLSNQYETLFLLTRVLQGKTRLVGVPYAMLVGDKQDNTNNGE